MNSNEQKIIKSLNKLGVDTRFISLYENTIYINNLKFSKFSRKKEDEFHKEFPDIEVIRSKLFQKICIKVSRTVKNQIKPRSKLFLENNGSLENIISYLVLEPYKRKYGITIVDTLENDVLRVNTECLDDFTIRYINQLTNGEEIKDNLEENTIYPLTHVPHVWMTDWIGLTNIKYESIKEYDETSSTQIIEFLEKHIPNVQESIKQSVTYLNEHKGE